MRTTGLPKDMDNDINIEIWQSHIQGLSWRPVCQTENVSYIYYRYSIYTCDMLHWYLELILVCAGYQSGWVFPGVSTKKGGTEEAFWSLLCLVLWRREEDLALKRANNTGTRQLHLGPEAWSFRRCASKSGQQGTCRASQFEEGRHMRELREESPLKRKI